MITKFNLRILTIIMTIAVAGLGFSLAVAAEKPAYVKPSMTVTATPIP